MMRSSEHPKNTVWRVRLRVKLRRSPHIERSSVYPHKADLAAHFARSLASARTGRGFLWLLRSRAVAGLDARN